VIKPKPFKDENRRRRDSLLGDPLNVVIWIRDSLKAELDPKGPVEITVKFK